MDNSRFQEKLVSLYLRLNGFFQTGLIVHSEIKGYNSAELDRLAVRFPYHRQEDRKIDVCSKLGFPESVIELLIVEVKNNHDRFNRALYEESRNPIDNWKKIIGWAGLLVGSEIETVTPLLIKTLSDSNNGVFNAVEANSVVGPIKIKPLLINIEGGSEFYDAGGIIGSDIIDYIWKCLCPEQDRNTCSTRYPFKNWGEEFEDLVIFFKSRNQQRQGKPALVELYSHFNINGT